MSEIISTRLRYVRATTAQALTKFVNDLTFKIEIKGNPVKDGKYWYLYFVLPDNIAIRMDNMEI